MTTQGRPNAEALGAEQQEAKCAPRVAPLSTREDVIEQVVLVIDDPAQAVDDQGAHVTAALEAWLDRQITLELEAWLNRQEIQYAMNKEEIDR
jgi:hypothetical protein